jgi:hypothetical protein
MDTHSRFLQKFVICGQNSFITLAPGACIKKHFTGIINSVIQKASVFVKASKNRLLITKALAYYITEFITAVKYFMIEAPVACIIKLL